MKSTRATIGRRWFFIQSASSLLFNRHRRAVAFRQKLFTTYRVEEIINLSALRFRVFKRKTHATKTSVSPACVVILSPNTPQAEDRIAYTSPKQLDQLIDEFQIIIEPLDRRSLTLTDATSDVIVWTSLMWGTNRDRALLARLRTWPSLAEPGPEYQVSKREGIIFGDKGKSQPELRGRRILKDKSFPTSSLIYLDADNLPALAEVKTHSRDSTDFSAFSLPQLIVKQGWQKEVSRFQARLVRSRANEGTLC